ncbi:hypothetical protein [Streptomyces sp. sk226]|uniref:hypothetical protein n=1 Tax=Streptomyces sp. sk226 TaxID=2034268 RepID=UPI001186B9D1|nr:hypothetical protein [Streptomyces sp. sk226]
MSQSASSASPDIQFTPVQKFCAEVSYAADVFWWHIDALMEVTDTSIPEVEKLDSHSERSSTLKNAMATLSEGSVNKIGKAFEEYDALSKEGSEDGPNFMEIMWNGIKGEPWGPAFMSRLHETLQRPPRLPIFLQSTMVSLVSNFEVLFSSLVADYYEITPQALEAASRDKGKEFSLRELKEMDTLSDAIDIAIGRRVDELMFGSFTDWKKFFSGKMNLDFEDYAINWDSLQEIFQRRHVIVHNGGRVSLRYLRNVAPQYAADVKVGDALRIDQKYVEQAADELLAFGFLLSMAMGIKLAKQELLHFNSRLHTFTYRNLVRKRYRVVEKCANFGEKISAGMDDDLTYRVNKWIAKKGLGDETVDPEIRDWDTVALDSRYKLAKHCLLGQEAEAMEILESLYASGDLGFEDIIEWPLLQPLRGTPAYTALTRRMEVPEGWHLSEKIFFENPKSGTLHLQKCPMVGNDFKRKTIDQIDRESASLCKRCNPLAG